MVPLKNATFVLKKSTPHTKVEPLEVVTPASTGNWMVFGFVLSVGVLNRKSVVCGNDPIALDAVAICATTVLTAFKNVAKKSFASAAFQKANMRCTLTPTASIPNASLSHNGEMGAQSKDATAMLG